MKLNVKLSIGLVALIASTFGLASESFAQTTRATSTVTNESIDLKTGNDSNATPAAAAVIFSLNGQGNVTDAAVATSVGLRSAAAAVTKSSASQPNSTSITGSTTAAGLGSDQTLNLKVNARQGSVDFTTVQGR